MAERELVIGNKNYSSWSLRAWLMLREAGIPFTERKVLLKREDSPAAIRAHSPSARVPVVIEGDLVVWESLAIGEWAAECWPDRQLWPADPAARAIARAVTAEMHAGFAAMREHLPMDIRARHPGHRWPAEAQADIDRVIELWADCRRRFGAGGPFLFGRFGIADAMYAPVATRFVTYGVSQPPEAAAYVTALTGLAGMQEWAAAAAAEPEVIDYLTPAP